MTQAMIMEIVTANVEELRRFHPKRLVAKQAEYETVRDALYTLQRAAQQVLQADLKQSQQAVQEIAREYPVMQTFIGYLVADGERNARTDLEEAMSELRKVADERLSKHSYVPQRLEEQRDEVLVQARKLDDAVPQAEAFKDTGTWLGEAAQGYRDTTEVQMNALAEYADITRRSAHYLDEAATLHRAAFYVCAETLNQAARTIDALVEGDANHLFSRIRQAISLINRATSDLSRDIDSAQRGAPASELARGMEDLLRDAEVLTEPTWPASGDDTP